MRVKSKDIAEKLGLSPSAVSRALNNKGGVSEETRQKVLAYLNEQNRQAFSSYRQDNLPILFAIHKKHGEAFTSDASLSALQTSIQQEASSKGFALQVINCLPEQEDVYYRMLQNVPCSGIIVFAMGLSDAPDDNDISRYLAVGKPVISINGQFNRERIDYVSMDNNNALFRAVQYGYQLGHRKIGYLQSELRVTTFETMYTGFLRGMRVYGLDTPPLLIYELPLAAEQAYQKMKNLLKRAEVKKTLPSLFIAETDYIAIGAMRALKESGYSVPADVSVIGNGDVPECMFVEPQLTTFRMSFDDIGRLAARRLIDIITDADTCCSHTQIIADLIERGSVADRR